MLAPRCVSLSAFLNGQRREEHCDSGNNFVSRFCRGTIRTRHSDEQHWRYDAARSLRVREPPRQIHVEFDEYDHHFCTDFEFELRGGGFGDATQFARGRQRTANQLRHSR